MTNNIRKLTIIISLVFCISNLFGQSLNLPEGLKTDINNSKIIAFCECIHGSDQLQNAQINLINEIGKKHKIGQVYYERNGLYLSNSPSTTSILKMDSTIKVLGYNPGNLRPSYLYIEQDLKKNNLPIYSKIAPLFNQVDSNESYYWYSISNNQYDILLTQLRILKDSTSDKKIIEYINQLEYDVLYLKHRKTKGDAIRDSLMFQFILKNIDMNNSSKAIVFGHCGHLAKKNPYLKHNLGYYLEDKYKDQFLVIGNDSREIDVVFNNGEKRHDINKNGLKINTSPNGELIVSIDSIKNKKYKMYLVGSDFNLKRKFKINVAKNYDWLFYFNKLNIIL
jgi:hypothetical protein